MSMTKIDDEEPDWLTDLDRDICSVLDSTEIMTPALIAKNIDGNRSSVSRRLSTLEAGGLVEKVERGHYKLTEEGFDKLARTVPSEVIDDPTLPEGVNPIKIPNAEEAKMMESEGNM
jgi:Mn-dependent DtxR family transcriptional regulator